MFFFCLYGFSILTMAILSVTRIVDHRHLWWQAAWTLAAATFAINQFCLYLNWDVDPQAGVDVVDLMLTLVTPITVLLVATLNHSRRPRVGPVSRALICCTAGVAALGLWLPALFMMQCVLNNECL